MYTSQIIAESPKPSGYAIVSRGNFNAVNPTLLQNSTRNEISTITRPCPIFILNTSDSKGLHLSTEPCPIVVVLSAMLGIGKYLVCKCLCFTCRVEDGGWSVC